MKLISKEKVNEGRYDFITDNNDESFIDEITDDVVKTFREMGLKTIIMSSPDENKSFRITCIATSNESLDSSSSNLDIGNKIESSSFEVSEMNFNMKK